MKLLEKVLITCLFVLVVVYIFESPFVSAYNPFKWQICQSANLSGGLCDDYWEAFKVYVGIPNETATGGGDFLNKTKLNELFYNKTTIASLYLNKDDAKKIIGNITANLSKNNITIKEDFLKFKTEIESKVNELKENSFYNNSSNSDDNTIIFIIIGVCVLMVGGYVFLNKKNNNQTFSQVSEGYPQPQSFGRPEIRKIQTKRDLSLEKEIEQLKQEISKKQEKPEEREDVDGD